MLHPWIDASHEPIYVVTFPARASHEELEQWIHVIDAFYASNDAPFGWLIRLQSLQSSVANQRKLIADHHARNREQLLRYCFGIAYVADQPLHRGAVSAFLWMAPPVYPYTVCADAEEGMRWLRERQRAFVG